MFSILAILGCSAEAPGREGTPFQPGDGGVGPGAATSAGDGGSGEAGSEETGLDSAGSDAGGETAGPGDDGGAASGGDPSGGDPSGGDPTTGGDPSGGDPSGGDPSGGDPSGGDPTGGGPDYGDCGWLPSDSWYGCGGMGEDPSAPIACPGGLVQGAPCGSVTGVGCCEPGGTNWYCNNNGTLTAEECGGADPSGGDPSGGDPSGGDPSGGDPSGGDPSGGDPSGGDPSGGGGDPGDPGPFASNIRISEIEVNQGVAIPIMRNGSLISPNNRNAPLIRNRHALVRVYWQTLNGFSPRNIEGRLVLDHGNGDVEVVADVVNVNGAPNPNSLGGTFTFELDPDQVTPGMDFSVALHETTNAGGNPASPPRFPSSGTSDMGVPSTRMKVALTIVPYRVGSTNPNLGANALQVFRDHFYAYQPIEYGQDGLRLRVYSQTQSTNSSDVQSVLPRVCSLWNSDVNSGAVDRSEYYQAAVASNTTYGVLGVAYVLSSPNGGQRCGANLWNSQLTQGPGTMTHEIGHNMGRPHAPCGGVSQSDPGYPYNGGRIGVQGWDPVENRLIPNNYTDYMGYCNNAWISDYNYRNNAQRNAALQVSPLIAGPLPPPKLLLVGQETTDGRQFWSVYEGQTLESGLGVAGTATVWTVEGKRLDVTVYERELSAGRAVVAEIPAEVSNPDDVAWISSAAFGSVYEIEPAIMAR